MNRRNFLTAPALLAVPLAADASLSSSETSGLDGQWQLRFPGQNQWQAVTVPHTWQVMPGREEYYGPAEYRRTFYAPKEWSQNTVRIEFEAVFHSAWVTLNGKPVGQHLGKGYTAFTLDLTPALKFGADNLLEVKVDNGFNETMLPRARSSDWAHDGGIYRPVHLHVTPRIYLEHLSVDATPEAIEVHATVRGESAGLVCEIVEEATGAIVARGAYTTVPGENRLTGLKIANPKLWHFDHPNLYRLKARLANGHALETTFGIRTFEARADGFYLNGEKVLLMGVERMAGSNPEFGMAEPVAWLDHDHNDMKELNCVFTRVHWQQDRRMLDYCDRHGMLVQLEVPGWGPKTFEGMKDQPSAELLNNGLEQLREMIGRDRNHPCVVAWGVCNEVDGQNPPAQVFIRKLYAEAKKLDPSRLVTYASHSLFKNPERDVSGEMDFVEWNQYFGSWQKGGVPELRAGLEQLHRAFPKKLIVISEYGYCACTAERPENDGLRTGVLRDQTVALRDYPYVAGLIFFCYNDYRTQIGDKGEGVMKQRVHGVVDIYGNRKASFDELRRESSPVEWLRVQGRRVELKARATVPAYPLAGYTIRAVVYGAGEIPLERREFKLATLQPGQTAAADFAFSGTDIRRVVYDVMRPTGFSAWTTVWKP